MKRILLLLTLVLSCQLLFGQRQSYAGYLEAGDEAVLNADYYSAYQFYRIALEFPGKANDPAGLARLGGSAYSARAYRVSADALLKLLALPEAADYPNTRYYLAEDYFFTGNYDLAALNYQTFLDEQPDAYAAYRERAERNIADANWAIEELAEERQINMNHLGTPVNSDNSDFGYVKRTNGDAYLSSLRFPFKKDSMNPPRFLSKIMLQKAGGEPKELDEPMNWEDRVVAHTAFNSTGDILFFTVCQYTVRDEMRCELYRADVTADGSCNNVRPVDELNLAGASTTMPNFGKLEDGSEVVFFASNREGGMGGMDLYMSPISGNGTPGLIQPLSAINTAGNDVTPFYYNDRHTLFFATDGLFTFGGLDVFKSYAEGMEFTSPINLGSPVNSSYDDAYYSQLSDNDLAYLSSTRQAPDAIFYSEDKEVCCYDIYSFEPDNRVDLLARTFNLLTDAELLGATVGLYEMTPNGPILIDEFTNEEGNDFSFKLDPGKRYELRASKPGFTRTIDAFDLNDPELVNKGLIRRDLYMAPGVELDVFSFNGNDDSALNGVMVNLFELDADGNRIPVAEQMNPTGNDVTFQLEAGKRYVIVGTRDGFGEATKEIDLRNYTPNGERLREDLYLGQLLEILVVDGVTNDPLTGATVDLARLGGSRVAIKTNENGNDFTYTVNLNRSFVVKTSREDYQSRTDTLFIDPAELANKGGKLRFVIPLFSSDITRLLPLQVYFDNDNPNPRTTRTKTNLTYPQTYRPYFNRREQFIEEYTAGLDRNEAFVLGSRFEDFFTLQVKGGHDKLLAFAQALENHLASGNNFNLELRGYASPRAAEDYNRRLSARRNDSVRNFFKRYNKGALQQYIDSGKLKFSEVSYGETRPTAETISDRLDDPKESVFSVIASLQRRVELGNADDTEKRRK